MPAFIDQIVQVFHRTSWTAIVLWVGMLGLTIALLVLVRTRWGQTQPLRKCIGLSLVAHLLLALYAMTVEIVGAAPGAARGQGIHATLWDEGPVEWEVPVANDAEMPAADIAETPPVVAQSSATPPPTPETPATNPPAPPPLLASEPIPLVASRTPAEKAASPETATIAPSAADQPPAITPPLEVAAKSVEAEQSPTPAMAEEQSTPVPAASVRPEGMLVEQAVTSPQAEPQEPHLAPAIAAPITEAKTNALAAPAMQALNQPDAGTPATSPATSSAAIAEAAQPPEMFRDRFAANRLEILRSRGGSPETEAAVQRALQWLAAAQSRDGSWDADRYGAGQERLVLGHDRKGAGKNADSATTGLALLALMGAGHTHLDQGPYAETIRRGLESLLVAQRREGSLAGDAELFAAMYSHGIAALALSEAFALTDDKRLEPGVRAAIDYTVRAQNVQSGSWRYQPNDQGDMSQLGWQLMALKSAEVAGIPTPPATRDGMIRFVQSASSGEFGGLAAYRPNERATRTMTAEALVARQFLGMSRENPAAIEASDYLLGELPSEKKINLYYWYYGTLGMYQIGGEPWREWNAAMQKTLLARQRTGEKLDGSWDPDCIWGGYGGRVYSTAVSALCLEVYYRYLPLYQHEQRIAERNKSVR